MVSAFVDLGLLFSDFVSHKVLLVPSPFLQYLGCCAVHRFNIDIRLNKRNASHSRHRSDTACDVDKVTRICRRHCGAF